MGEGAAPAWRLAIAEGPQAGATVDLPDGTYSIGCDLTNDIVLCDPTVAGAHMTVRIAARNAAVTALAPGGRIGRRSLQTGESIGVSDTAELRLGETLVRVSRAPDPAMARPVYAPLTAIAAVCIAVAAGTFYAAGPQAGTTRTSVRQALAQADLNGAVRALRGRLRSVHLADKVTVSVAEKAVVVTGILPIGSEGSWRQTVSWFDSHYASQLALLDRTSLARPAAQAAADLPDMRIAAIAMLPLPNLITRDGARYTEDTVLPDGWTIVSITLREVRLRKDGKDVVIKV